MFGSRLWVSDFLKKIKVFFSLKQKKKSQGDTFLSKAGTAWGGHVEKVKPEPWNQQGLYFLKLLEGWKDLAWGEKMNENSSRNRVSLSLLSPP